MTSADLPPVYRDVVDVVDDPPVQLQVKQIVPWVGLAAGDAEDRETCDPL
ncbi:hypothetical protein [Streptomyces sp. AA1529]